MRASSSNPISSGLAAVGCTTLPDVRASQPISVISATLWTDRGIP